MGKIQEEDAMKTQAIPRQPVIDLSGRGQMAKATCPNWEWLRRRSLWQVGAEQRTQSLVYSC